MQTKSKPIDVIKVYWQAARPYRFKIWLIAFFIIIANLLQLTGPIFYKKIIDALYPIVDIGLVYKMFVILVGLKLGELFLNRMCGFLNINISNKIFGNLNMNAFASIINQSYRFFINNFSGSLVRKVNRLSNSFNSVFEEILYKLTPALIILVGIIASLAFKFPKLAVALFVWSLIFGIVSYFSMKWKIKIDVLRWRKDSELGGTLSDAISNSQAVLTFASVNHEKKILTRVLDELAILWRRGWVLSEKISIIQGVMMIIIEMIVMFYAINLYKDGGLTIGDIFLLQGYLAIIFNNFWDIWRSLRKLFENFAEAAEMVDIINTESEVKDVLRAKNLKIKTGMIDFENVTFAYTKDINLLKNFNLSIRSKEKMALVGPSGAGKSTITKLLFRFFDVNKGKILIDGMDIAKVTQYSLRSSLSLVPQEPVLFHRSLFENIRYGRPNAKEIEVIEASKKAHCHEFISKLPQGYETLVGERGIKLSGGERQRVAIARAIVKNSPILVLDEATSSLDSESESLIQDALVELMKDKTVIVIAHRLSTIMKMDRIAVIENGAVTAIGSHGDLLENSPTYKKLWTIQAGGFIQ